MPYIRLKVSHDLYEELGLSPSMELICSDGSMKLIPVPDKRVLGDYESPLLTSPVFGNRPKETATGVFSGGITELPSKNATGVKKLKSSHEATEDPLVVGFPSSLASTPTTSQLNIGTSDISCIELDSRGRMSSVTLTASQSTAVASHQGVNPSFSTPDEEKTLAPVEEVKCDECFKVFVGNSVRQRYKKHKKVCDERKEKRLKAAATVIAIPECDPEIPDFLLLDVSQPSSGDEIKVGRVNPECSSKESVIEQKSFICECRLSFTNQLYYNIHVKKCKYLKKQSTSSNISPPCAAPVSNDPIVQGTDKYISIEKHPEFAHRFFIRKKDTD